MSCDKLTVDLRTIGLFPPQKNGVSKRDHDESTGRLRPFVDRAEWPSRFSTRRFLTKRDFKTELR